MNEVQREQRASEQNLQSKSLRARLCRTLNELCGAEEAGELVLTCLKCTKLFKDPYIMGPCGHTLCASCCGVGGGDEELPVEGNSGWVLGGGVGGSTKREKPACHLCANQPNGGEAAADTKIYVGMAPNRALATLVTKYAFRRQLLESLTDMSNALWREGPQIVCSDESHV